MKKIICILLLFLTISINVSAGYGAIVDIKHNGEYIDSDVKGRIINNSTYVPVRYAAKALGITDILWDAEEKKITLRSDNCEMILYAGKDFAYINGTETLTDVTPVIINGSTFIPIRFIAENFGSRVEWQSESYAANISNSLPVTAKRGSYRDDDIYWLSKIIEAESKGEPIEGKIAVGNVVINRKNSSGFPDTIYGVIYHKTNERYQFTPVANGAIKNEPSQESIIAAKLALNGTSLVGDCLYFSNPETTSSSWVSENRVYYKTINNHAFYL